MPAHQRLDHYQQTHSWLGLPIAVFYKFFDDQGPYLAALMTYYGFLSLFPLLLLAITVLGYFLSGNPDLQHDVLNSALANFPVVGNQLRSNVHAFTGSPVALAASLIVGLYGALGMAQAGQNAMNIVWGIPRNVRPNPIKARLRSLVVLGLLTLGVLATAALSALATGAHSLVSGLHLGMAARVLAVCASTALDIGLFLAGFRLLTARTMPLRDVLIGGTAAGVAWQLFQDLGTYYMSHELKGSREIYGVFGLVIGLMAWIYLEAIVVVLCAELNAVLRRRLWPRSLLTIFTDNVKLSHADKRAYRSYAKAQRFKSFQRIEVHFGRHGDNDHDDDETDPDEPAIDLTGTRRPPTGEAGGVTAERSAVTQATEGTQPANRDGPDRHAGERDTGS